MVVVDAPQDLYSLPAVLSLASRGKAAGPGAGGGGTGVPGGAEGEAQRGRLEGALGEQAALVTGEEGDGRNEGRWGGLGGDEVQRGRLEAALGEQANLVTGEEKTGSLV